MNPRKDGFRLGSSVCRGSSAGAVIVASSGIGGGAYGMSMSV